MIKEVIHLLQNQLFAGGFILMVVGSIIALLKDIPHRLYNFATHQLTSSVKITDDSSSSFLGAAYWIQQQRFFGKVRHTDVRQFYTEQNHNQTVFIPAPGTHWFFHSWRLMWFTFERTESKGGFADSRYNENFTIGVLGRNKNFLKEIIRSSTIEKQSDCLMVWSDYYWKQMTGYKPRVIDSVILPTEEKQKLIADIELFLKNEQTYTQSGTPYRRGYLFEGLPGTGKTSCIAGLSKRFEKNLYLIKPDGLTDSVLAQAISSIPKHSIAVIEDVDCVTTSRVQPKSKKARPVEKSTGITLSGLLNCLDGLRVPHGLLFFLTTNHVEKLDPALIRPGRVDFKMHFDYATAGQKQEYFDKFLRAEVPADTLKKKMVMAEVQQQALEIRNSKSEVL